MMREIGFFWVFVIALIAASAYFAPVIKQYLVTKIKSSARIEQVIENCTQTTTSVTRPSLSCANTTALQTCVSKSRTLR